MTTEPQHGFTKDGKPVHGSTNDHRNGDLNKRIGVAVTKAVGTMQAAYIFGLMALLSLPAILTQAFNLHVFPSWLVSASLIGLVAWLSSYFLQLTLLPIIIVGQNAQAEAGDARSTKGFEDTEEMLDLLNTHTAGGLTDLLDAINDLKERLPQ